MAVSMHWKLFAAAAAFSALAFGACGDDKDEGGGKQDAGSRADGGGGGGLGDIPIADLDDGVAGSPCTSSAECKGTNATCAKDPNDSESVAVCTGACNVDDNCGAGGACVKPITIGGAPGLCAKTCSANSECGTGLECLEGANFGSALDEITNLLGDAGLGDGLGDGGGGAVADQLPKTCQPARQSVDLPDGVVGKACADDEACSGGTCRKSVIGITYPEGYCTGQCYESSACGSTGACARAGIATSLGLPGSCMLKCTEAADCRTGYTCGESQLLGAGKYCIPAPPADAGVADSGTGDSGAQDAGVADATVDATVEADATAP